MNLRRHLKKLGKEVRSRWPTINHGGCCVFASIVGQELTKCGIQVVGVNIGDYTDVDEARSNIPQENRRYVREWSEQGINFYHVMLEVIIDGVSLVYDTDHLRRAPKKIKYRPVAPGRLSLDELKQLAADRDSWNDTFNRREIPALRRFIKAYFADVTLVDNATA